VELCENVADYVGYQFSENQTKLPQNLLTENSVSAVQFSLTNFGGLGTVFHVVSFTIIIQHDINNNLICIAPECAKKTSVALDGINSQGIFLHAISLNF